MSQINHVKWRWEWIHLPNVVYMKHIKQEIIIRVSRHEGVLGEWRYSSTRSWPRH